MEQRCPVCRSLLELDGPVDFSAPAIVKIICPVCGAEIWVPSGFPLPRKWSVKRVIERAKNYPTWDQITKQAPALKQDIPADAKKSVYADFFKPQNDLLKNLGSGIKNTAIFIVVILVLVLLIKWKK